MSSTGRVKVSLEEKKAKQCLPSIVIKEFLLSKFSDVSEVFIDPEKTNEKAVHVYLKVGFRIMGEFIAAWHPVPHHIMKLDMKNLR